MGGLIYRALVAIRGSIPFLIGFLLASLTFARYGAPEFSLVTPSLTLPVIYYWTLRQPELLPSWAVFLIGLWQDILIGGPLGLMALLLVLMRGAAETQRPVLLPQSALFQWFGYAILSLALTALGWVIASIWAGQFFDVFSFIGHWGLGVLLYGVLGLLFGRLNHFLFEQA